MSSAIIYTKPAQYDTVNLPQLRDAKLSLDKYFHLLRWKEQERVVDIGCGTGNVTTQILVPYLPTDYKLLVGFDLSNHNVKYAAENYSSPRIIFLQGDITESDFQTLKGFFEKKNISIGFDKVFSFNCLHWAKNSEQWSKNIYSLLKPGGQIFLEFFTYSTFVEMFVEVAFSERWIPYTKTIEPFRNEFFYSTDVTGDVTKMMTTAGFTVQSCEHHTCYVDKQYPDETIMRTFQVVDPHAHAIPEELQSDYFEDLYSTYKKYQNKYDTEPGLPYTIVVIVGFKPEN